MKDSGELKKFGAYFIILIVLVHRESYNLQCNYSAFYYYFWKSFIGLVNYVIMQADVRKINFCQWCGGPTKHEIPDGEEKMRAICTLCGKITYQNPKMVWLVIYGPHFYELPIDLN